MDSIWNLWNYVEYVESTWNLWGSVKYTIFLALLAPAISVACHFVITQWDTQSSSMIGRKESTDDGQVCNGESWVQSALS